ncbi:UNKNOWN [Stylonychia lemnae]|uniref:tRNA (GuanineN(7))methyltransferase n=1 Tax=Stylonychia lemnae TaxID=5949 RepID=A0A078AUH1_STYLE|nr:UNKNOWN [Stylonychia lemnae]|eukprot:CDW85661.1 UNKNOWN [Stylonychia lemnae]
MSQERLLGGANDHPGLQQEPAKKKYVPQPINQDQRNKAREVIKENHPLSGTQTEKVFPVLGPVARLFRKQQDESNVPLIDAENQKSDGGKRSPKKQVKLSQDMKDDPFNFLGFGMVAYRDLMLTLVILFTFLTIVMTPVMVIYSKHTAIQQPKSWTNLSLGNLGYTSSQCQRIPFDLKKVTMFCPFGLITDIHYLGINPDGITDRDSCIKTSQNQICFDHIKPEFQVSLQTIAQQKDNNDMSQDFKDTEIFKDPASVPAQCKNTNAQIYVQYSCEQPKELLERKYRELSYVSCLGAFAACVFSIVIYYFKRTSKLNQIDWDIQTITPGDYTLHYEITDEAYNNFLSTIYSQNGDEEKGVSRGMSLKNYLRKEIEAILTEKLQQVRATNPEECKNIKISTVKIADIAFSFNNAELISLLRERGQHIMYQRFDKMREAEAKISELKDRRFIDLTKPCDAFITFEEEDSSIIGQKFEAQYNFAGKRKPAQQKLLGEEFFLSECTEPTNIIWENRHWTQRDYIKRGTIVFTIITFLIIISFSLIFFSKSFSIRIFNKYPAVECDVIQKSYTVNKVDMLPQYAQREFDGFYNSGEGKEPTPLSGALQCHCEQIKKNGTISLLSYASPNGSKICRQYYIDYWLSFISSSAVQYMIIGINFVLRLVIIKLIIFIGKDTESEQTKLITNGVFVVQFFNTAFLLLLVNANMTEQAKWLGIFFNGRIGDFNTYWFSDIGKTLIGAMLFNIYWPIFEVGMWYGYRLFFRLWDKGFKTCNDNVTKKTTVQQYVELYSGPIFFIHYKYSSILNITFVTMMYGLGIPVLFPIAVFSFFVLYVVEKSMVYWSYRLPPMYDDKLNNNVLSLMTYAPLLFLSFGYWMLSSKQLYGNDVQYLESASGAPKTGHVWWDFFIPNGYQSGPGLPLIIFFWIFFFGTLFRNQIYKYLARWFPRFIKVGDIEIDENLDNYFKTIDDNDRKWSITEEENARSAYNLKVLQDETLQKFKDTQLGDSVMKGVHCYDILANPLYLDDFQYFSPSMEDREKYIIDDDDDEGNDTAQSDLVKLILNLAFLTEKQAREFTFSKNACKNQQIGGSIN